MNSHFDTQIQTCTMEDTMVFWARALGFKIIPMKAQRSRGSEPCT